MSELEMEAYRRAWERCKPFTIMITGCWEPRLRSYSKGYVAVSINGKKIPAHKVSYIVNIETVPPGLHILHKCDNKRCVNPEHLYMGTHFNNMQDNEERNGHGGSHNTPGQYFFGDHHGENNPSAKLNWNKVREIRTSGLTQKELSRIYGIARSTISYIRTGRLWKEELSNGGR